MWVEFVVGSLLCSERFFSGYSGFPLSSKTNISKFQFHSGMHWHFKRVLVNSWCSVGKQITGTLTLLHFFVFEEKAHDKFQIVFHPHKNYNLELSNSSGLKSIFEKVTIFVMDYYGLLAKPSVEIKLRCQIFSRLVWRGPHLSV